MPYPLPLTRTEAYLAYKAGVIQQSDLKPSLAVPRNGIDAWLAYWTGLAEDYPKREDGTPHILQEEEAYIAYLCGVIDEYPEKCLRRVGAYLRYIISARWGRPDHPLNREELYLSLIKTQFIPSGDPSSDIGIDGTAKAEFVDVKVYGDTYQQSYTGKNLFEAVPYSDPIQQGLTITITNTNTIHIEGTANTTYSNLTNNMSCLLPSGQPYTFCIDKVLTHNLSLRTTWEGGYADRVITPGNQSITFTPGNDITSMRIFMATRGAGNTFNETITAQLVTGSTPDYDFEPYVGGQPSPSPEYPQPIQTVTGEQMVEIVGKNLFDKDNMDTRNGYLYRTIFSYRTTNADRAFIVPCEPNTTYTISRSVITSSFMAAYIDLGPSEIPADASSETSLTCAGYIANNSGTSITITTSATAKSLLVHYGNTNTDGVTLIDQSVATIMVEKSASATAYAPYSKHTYPISLGNIELCGLGTYQDYIWEDGEDWKIHKATDRFIFTNAITSGLTRQSLGFVYNASGNPLVGKHTPLVGKCSHFDVEPTTTTWTALNKTGMNSLGALWFRTTDTNLGDTRTIEEFGQWLVDARVSFVYALEAPTDTVITDQNLISQLNALKKGGSEEGTTYIKVSATDPNLPAKLYVEAAKYV